MMIIDKQRTKERREEEGRNGMPVKQTADEACRCKEAAQMTPRELLKLMMDDLAFWKKGKKR